MSDLQRGYRICNFNDTAHKGVHLHLSLTGKATRRISIPTESDAAQFVRHYAGNHDSFDRTKIEAEVKAWKSK